MFTNAFRNILKEKIFNDKKLIFSKSLLDLASNTFGSPGDKTIFIFNKLCDLKLLSFLFDIFDTKFNGQFILVTNDEDEILIKEKFFKLDKIQIKVNETELKENNFAAISIKPAGLLEMVRQVFIEYKSYISGTHFTGNLVSSYLNSILSVYNITINNIIKLVMGFEDNNYQRLISTSTFLETGNDQILSSIKQYAAINTVYGDLVDRFIINIDDEIYEIKRKDKKDENYTELLMLVHRIPNFFSCSFNSGRGFNLETFLFLGIWVLTKSDDLDVKKINDIISRILSIDDEIKRSIDIDISNPINILNN